MSGNLLLEQTPNTNSRHSFDGHARLNPPLPVWTKTTLPPDALQRGPVASPHGRWPFHTASGQSRSPKSPRSNTHLHQPPQRPTLDGDAGRGRSPSVPSMRGVSGAPVLRDSAQASLEAPWWNELKGPSLSQHQAAITAAWTGKAHLTAPQALNHG